MKDNNLDKLLKDWDANKVPDKSRNEKIKKNIMDNLEKPVQNREYRFVDPYFHIHKKVLYFAGVAATVCFAFLIGTQFNKQSSVEKTDSNQMVLLSQDEIMKLKKISSEIDNLFPEGVKMISQTNNGDFQINTEKRQGLDDTNEKVLVRYIVMKKTVGENKWEQVHVSNVIANAGEPIELKGKDSGHIWIYPADKNVYAVESNLKIKANGEIINLDYTGGQELRTPQTVKVIKNSNNEYKVFQTLVRI